MTEVHVINLFFDLLDDKVYDKQLCARRYITQIDFIIMCWVSFVLSFVLSIILPVILLRITIIL